MGEQWEGAGKAVGEQLEAAQRRIQKLARQVAAGNDAAQTELDQWSRFVSETLILSQLHPFAESISSEPATDEETEEYD